MKPIPFRASLPRRDLLSDTELVEDVKQKYRQWQQDGRFYTYDQVALYLLRLTNPAGELGQGLLGLLPAEAYGRGEILPHEATLEAGRVRQVQALTEHQAMTKPVLLTYRQSDTLKAVLIRAFEQAVQLSSLDYLGYRFEYFALNDKETIKELTDVWASAQPQLLVADGHHRLASSLSLQTDDAYEAPEYFPALLLADECLKLDAFYRLIERNPMESAEQLLNRLATYFMLERLGTIEELRSLKSSEADGLKPTKEGEWLLCIQEQMYRLHRQLNPADALLDPIWFNDCILPEIFDIHDSRTDNRIISKAMGPRGKSLIALAKKHPNHAIFAGYPIRGASFFELIERHELLPPKSTCFYPRIPSGMVVYDWLV